MWEAQKGTVQEGAPCAKAQGWGDSGRCRGAWLASRAYVWGAWSARWRGLTLSRGQWGAPAGSSVDYTEMREMRGIALLLPMGPAGSPRPHPLAQDCTEQVPLSLGHRE